MSSHLQVEADTNNPAMSKLLCVPLKLYLQNQAVGPLLFEHCSKPTPVTVLLDESK